MKSSITFLILLSATASSHATEYSEIVRTDNPVVYWNFTNPKDLGESELSLAHEFTPAPLRGLEGLAGTFSRSTIRGHAVAKLDDQQNKKITDLLNSSFTLEVWFLDEAPAANGSINYSIFYKADAPGFTQNSIWLYRKRQDGNLLFTLQGRSDELIRIAIDNPALLQVQNSRTFHHLAITVKRSTEKNTGKITAFIDGKQVNQTLFTASPTVNNSGDLFFGNNHQLSSPWEGRLDEFAIYDKVLKADRIQEHYEAGKKSLTHEVTRNPSTEEKEAFFETRIRPVLVERCATCHTGEPDADSPLATDSRNALLTGGEYGPAVIPFRAEDSLLIAAIQKTHKELRMPPEDGDELTRKEIQDFYRWINDGAVWPGSMDTPVAAKEHNDSAGVQYTPELDWAFSPRKVTAPPLSPDPKWNTNPIDQFVDAARRTKELPFNPQATRNTLIRRATLDLTGLPPTREEVHAFIKDNTETQVAFAKVIDRLLQSPRYGERQGRLWLDIARYADTQGDVGDIPIHSAYRYRNWVINSLNRDMPYNAFIQAQIAGDLLAVDSSNSEQAKDLNVATGFISLSRRFGNRKADSLHMTIEDTLDTIGRGVMGITLRCARCHDHKFDPIPTADYYGMYGIFRSTVYPWMGMSDEKSPFDLNPIDPLSSSTSEGKAYWELIARYEYQINNHHRPWLKPTLDAFKKTDTEFKQRQAELAELEKSSPDSEEIPALRSAIEELQQQRDDHLNFRSGAFRELMIHGLAWIRSEKDQLGKNPPFEFVFSVRDGDAADAPIHLRGNPENPGQTVPRHFLSTITPMDETKITAGSGRLQLATWLTRDDHPLTPRVVVNRIWAQHFGRGIVESLDNFGRQGKRPTHPELLDWLTESFVTNGWSIKALHRQIMLSQTYQLSSLDESQEALLTDPDNVYLWRFSRQRLDAESIRDSILFTSGQLDLTQPGAHPLDPWYNTRYNLNTPFHKEYDHNHRSVYLITQRIFRHSLLGLFDSPDTNSSTASRNSSNVPAQALFLMNSKFIENQSHALAVRTANAKPDDDSRIRWLFEHLYSRDIESDELTAIMQFLKSYRQTPTSGPVSSAAVLPEYLALCRVLLTSNEFFYID